MATHRNRIPFIQYVIYFVFSPRFKHLYNSAIVSVLDCYKLMKTWLIKLGLCIILSDEESQIKVLSHNCCFCIFNMTWLSIASPVVFSSTGLNPVLAVEFLLYRFGIKILPIIILQEQINKQHRQFVIREAFMAVNVGLC